MTSSLFFNLFSLFRSVLSAEFCHHCSCCSPSSTSISGDGRMPVVHRQRPCALFNARTHCQSAHQDPCFLRVPKIPSENRRLAICVRAFSVPFFSPSLVWFNFQNLGRGWGINSLRRCFLGGFSSSCSGSWDLGAKIVSWSHLGAEFWTFWSFWSFSTLVRNRRVWP